MVSNGLMKAPVRRIARLLELLRAAQQRAGGQFLDHYANVSGTNLGANAHFAGGDFRNLLASLCALLLSSIHTLGGGTVYCSSNACLHTPPRPRLCTLATPTY
jgi:hypothetical protein